MRHSISIALLAACAAIISCTKEGEKLPDPEILATPVLTCSEPTTESFTVSWEAVENASAYAWSISSGETMIDSSEECTETSASFTGLTAGTSYEVTVKALSGDKKKFLDSKEATISATTKEAPTEPWVDTAFEYAEIGGKNTLVITNTPNILCTHYYSTTANVNVIGEGYDDEQTFINYMVMDYEYGEPGVYRDSGTHQFNNNGAGFSAGDTLFYGVAGEDADGKTGKLNWAWIQMPQNPGDQVIILDGPGVQSKLNQQASH